MSESIDLLLTNGTVVTMDTGGNVFLDGAVAIRGRAIIAVGTAAELAERYGNHASFGGVAVHLGGEQLSFSLSA
jgi:predicted amidohydrolase YtcJ